MSKNRKNPKFWMRNHGSNGKHKAKPLPLAQFLQTEDGKPFKLALLMVRSRNEDGTPRVLEYIRDDDTVDLTRPEETEFVTAYVNAQGFGPSKEKL